jgi:hypothetical protein
LVTALVIATVLSVLGVSWVVFRTGSGVAASAPGRFEVSRANADYPEHPTPATDPANEPATDPAGEPARDPPREPVITPAEAEVVARRYWRRHEAALAGRDLSRLAALSAGSARRWERGAVACGCYRVDGPRPLESAAYFVPRQTRYPAYFLVQVRTRSGGQPWAELLVFTASTAHGRWRVAHDSGFGLPAGGTAGLGVARTGSGGYLRPLAAVTTAAQRRRSRTAAGDLADFWRRAKEQGEVPASSQFRLTGQALGRARWLAEAGQDEVQVNGYLGHFRFFVERDAPRFEVVEASGALLTCQSVRETVVYRSARPGGLIGQDPARKAWGALLAPGSYRSVTSRDYWQTCFRVPRDPGRPITVLNQDVGGALPDAA